MKTKYLPAAAALVLLAAGCSQDEASQLDPNGNENSGQRSEAAPAGPVWFFGTVHRLPENGGAWVVRTAGGTQYQPTDLPEEFQVDGLAVDVKAQKLETVMTKEAPGQAIDIVEIRRRGGS